MRVDYLTYINYKNQKLECNFFFPEKFDPSRKYETIPMGHGLGGSNQSPYILASIPEIVKSDRIAVAYNLTGAHPEHPDTTEATPQNWKKDLKSVMETIADKPYVDKNKIIPINASKSANLIVQLAADADSVEFAGIITDALATRPMRKFEKKLKDKFGLCRRLWSWKKLYPVDIDGKKCQLNYDIYRYFSKYDLVRDAASKITIPYFDVHGTKDTLAPIEDARELVDAMVNSPFAMLYEIEDAPHNMVDSDKGNFLSQAMEFNRQAVEMISTGDFSRIVDVNGRAYNRRPNVA